MSALSGRLFYPLWDLKDKSIRLKELRRLEKTQWLTESQLRDAQWEKLIKIVRYAHAHSLYYRKRFVEQSIDVAQIVSQEQFRNLPILTKEDVQNRADQMISDEYAKEKLISAKTGGSTGKALKLYFDKQCEEMRNAAAIRSDRWAGWELGMKRAGIWGNPPVADTIKKKIRDNLHDRMIYLDTMNINPETILQFVNSWRRYQPQVIYGHSHSIYILAKYLEDRGIIDLRPRGVISTSMMLLPHEREVIEKVFLCRVTNRYGCEEVGLIACECEEHNGMHLNADHLYVEFIREDGMPAKPGEEGKMVVTDLLNQGMPLIRYRVEDVGVPSNRRCPCGRGLPLMERVAGRVADFLKKKDGSQVAGVSLVERTVTAIKGIGQMQIVQEKIDQLVLNVVRMAEYDAASERALLSEFASVFGKEVSIQLNYMDNIRQESSGKYRFSICKIGIA
jgi:phenylacetate-CoA ligase